MPIIYTLNMLAETGIPGLLSFLAVIVGHVITSIRLKGDIFRQAANWCRSVEL